MALKFGTSGLRGLNTEFTPTMVQAYVEAFIGHAKGRTRFEAVAVAGDLRESTPGIQRLVMLHLEALGLKVLDCQQLPTI